MYLDVHHIDFTFFEGKLKYDKLSNHERIEFLIPRINNKLRVGKVTENF